MRVSVAAGKAGVPAVSIIATPFLAQGRAFAQGLGASEPAIAEYPGVPMLDSDDERRDKVIDKLLPQILAGWTQRKETSPAQRRSREAEPSPRDIVFRGTLQEVQDYFDDQLWSDGLPVIPPTRERVEAFLNFTDRSPDQVLGVCQPDFREATIWNIAVNGVMAGCRPEYMPVLIAAVEAITDPAFWLEDAGATPGWEPLIILNGPIIHELDFNYGGGVMRVGRRSNTSIGRFLRLYIRNVAGQRIPRGGDKATGLAFGSTDKGTIGMSFNVVLAENEDACAAMGWKSFSVERGFAPDENVVTVQSMMSVSQPTYTSGKAATQHLEIIREVIGQMWHYLGYTGIRHRMMYPLIVMSPSIAKAIAEDGWSKADVKQYLYDNVKMPAKLVEKYAHNRAMNDYDLKAFVASGMIPPEYHESDDPDRLVRVLVKPEWIGIVVAGDPGRNQSRGYPQNSWQGVPVSKKIELPKNWQGLLKRSPRG